MGHLCYQFNVHLYPHCTLLQKLYNMVGCSLVSSLAPITLSLQFPSTFLITVFNILLLDNVLHARITFTLLYKTES
jgi:hypothetical protein